jgi:hypothetical protein
MPDAATLYPWFVYIHLLLFVFWLGADLGVFILGQHFRKPSYSIAERLTILKLLVITDMGPRTAWALMVPVSITMLALGGFWAVPLWGVALSWAVGGGWLWLVWYAHGQGQTDQAAKARKIEDVLKWGLAMFYLGLGGVSLATGAPLVEHWLASKALLFGVIFVVAIMIDVAFKPVGPLLGALIAEGSSPKTEVPLLKAMNTTRIWVTGIYILLVITSLLGNMKPAF